MWWSNLICSQILKKMFHEAKRYPIWNHLPDTVAISCQHPHISQALIQNNTHIEESAEMHKMSASDRISECRVVDKVTRRWEHIAKDWEKLYNKEFASWKPFWHLRFLMPMCMHTAYAHQFLHTKMPCSELHMSSLYNFRKASFGSFTNIIYKYADMLEYQRSHLSWSLFPCCDNVRFLWHRRNVYEVRLDIKLTLSAAECHVYVCANRSYIAAISVCDDWALGRVTVH